MLVDGSSMQTRHRVPANKYFCASTHCRGTRCMAERNLGMVADLTPRSLAKRDQVLPPAQDVDLAPMSVVSS